MTRVDGDGTGGLAAGGLGAGSLGAGGSGAGASGTRGLGVPAVVVRANMYHLPQRSAMKALRWVWCGVVWYLVAFLHMGQIAMKLQKSEKV